MFPLPKKAFIIQFIFFFHEEGIHFVTMPADLAVAGPELPLEDRERAGLAGQS